MKFLSAAFTALVVVGFAGAASAACANYDRQAAQSAEAPIVVEPGSTGS